MDKMKHLKFIFSDTSNAQAVKVTQRIHDRQPKAKTHSRKIRDLYRGRRYQDHTLIYQRSSIQKNSAPTILT